MEVYLTLEKKNQIMKLKLKPNKLFSKCEFVMKNVTPEIKLCINTQIRHFLNLNPFVNHLFRLILKLYGLTSTLLLLNQKQNFFILNLFKCELVIFDYIL